MTTINDKAEIEVVLRTENAQRDLAKLLENQKGNTAGGSSGGTGGGGGGGPAPTPGPGGGGGGGGGLNAMLGNLIKAVPMLSVSAMALERAAKLFERSAQDIRDATDPTLETAGILHAKANATYMAGHEGRAQKEAMGATSATIMQGMGMLDAGTIDAVHEQNKMIAGMRKQAAIQVDDFKIRQTPQNFMDTMEATFDQYQNYFKSLYGAVMR